MSRLVKLLGLFALGRKFSLGGAILSQLLSGIAVVAGMALLSAILATTLIIGGSYIGYNELIKAGYTGTEAAVIVGSLLATLTVIFVFAACRAARRISRKAKELLYLDSPITYKLGSIAESFMDGLRTTPTAKPAKSSRPSSPNHGKYPRAVKK